jgi:hypothetical protein
VTAFPSVVARENARAGSTAWLLDRPYPRLHGNVRSHPIEGYCSHTSVAAGERLGFHVSANPAAPVTIDLFRMGWYGGAGGRQVATLGPIACEPQATPPVGPERVRACDWSETYALEIPDDWLSGVYLGKLTELEGGWQSYVIFVVRDERPVELLFQCSDLTWQAYNHWPDLWSLYTDGYRSWYNGPGVAVSFRRPYGKYVQYVDSPLTLGSGEWLLSEFPLAFWLEAEGADVSYQSGLDLHARPLALQRANGLLSVGHDEYLTRGMYDALAAAIDAGLNVAFLGGNSLAQLVELDGVAGADTRATMRRVDCLGRRDERLLAAFPDMAAFPWSSPDANELMGSGLSYPIVGGGDWTCAAPEHWVFEGTGMARGDSIPGLVGWEFHGDPVGRPGLSVVAEGPTRFVDRDGSVLEGTYAATAYEGPCGNTVFNAATCWWSDGLSEPPGYRRSAELVPRAGPDRRVQQMTRNVMARLRVRQWDARRTLTRADSQ